MNAFGAILNTVLVFLNQFITSLDERTEKKFLWRKAYCKDLKNSDLVNYCNATSSDAVMLLCIITRIKYIAETCNNTFALLSLLLLKQNQFDEKIIENEIMNFINQLVATMKDDNFVCFVEHHSSFCFPLCYFISRLFNKKQIYSYQII